MPKKFLSGRFFFCLFFFFIFSAGCAQKPAATVTLRMAMSLGEQEWKVFRAEIFPAFEKENNLKIEAFQIDSGQLVTKLAALQAAERGEIDLFAQDNMNLAMLINRDLVLDLSEYEKNIPVEVLPNLIASCKFDQRLMFMPFRPNVQIIYYNVEAFKKYNLQPPKTWEELLQVAKKFREEEGEGRVLLKAFGGNPTATQVYEFILQAGGNPYDFDDAGCIKAFEYLQKLWPFASTESRRAKWDTTNELLAQQNAYIAQNWPFGITVLVEDYKLNFIRTYSGWSGPGGELHVIGGDVFGIPKNCAHKETALKFISYMQSKQVQEILVAKLGWPSIRPDAYAGIQDWQRDCYQAVVDALKYGVFRKNVTWWPAYAKYISECFREIVINQAPVEETLSNYKKKLEKEKLLYQ